MRTGIRITAQNNDIIYARTLEFWIEVDSQIICIPRSYAFNGTTPDGQVPVIFSIHATIGTRILLTNYA